MIFTEEFVNRKFSEFNSLLFAGRLTHIPVKLVKARSFVGKFMWRIHHHPDGRKTEYDHHFRFSTSYDHAERELEDIIIHEMIHYYIYATGQKDTSSHGRIFRALADEINTRHGRNITVRHKVTAESTENNMRFRKSYVAVVKFIDGQIGFHIPAETRLAEHWRCIPKLPEVKAVSWYGSFAPWFNRFPRLRSMKFYIADAVKLRTALQDGVSLTSDGRIIKPSLTPDFSIFD